MCKCDILPSCGVGAGDGRHSLVVVVEATDYSPAILDYDPFQSGAVEFNAEGHDAASMIAPARTMVRQIASSARQDRIRIATASLHQSTIGLRSFGRPLF
jgi:hypothetical protein